MSSDTEVCLPLLAGLSLVSSRQLLTSVFDASCRPASVISTTRVGRPPRHRCCGAATAICLRHRSLIPITIALLPSPDHRRCCVVYRASPTRGATPRTPRLHATLPSTRRALYACRESTLRNNARPLVPLGSAVVWMLSVWRFLGCWLSWLTSDTHCAVRVFAQHVFVFARGAAPSLPLHLGRDGAVCDVQEPPRRPALVSGRGLAALPNRCVVQRLITVL